MVEEVYIYDDPERALVKAEELSPTAPRIARRYIEAVRARDWEALAELYNDDCVFVEHRRVGWEDFNGVDGLIAMFESTLELAADATVRGEVLRDEGGDLYLRQILTGTWEGGPWEVALDTISELRDGRFSRIEQFDLDQREQLRARLAELRAERRASRRGEWQALLADDVSVIDLRSDGWGTLHGASSASARLGGSLVGRRLAHRDDVSLVGLAAGSFAVAIAGRGGELACVELYDHEHAARDRFAAIAEDPDALLSMRLGVAWFQALNRRDLTAARACLADDLVVIDHRPASPFPSEVDGGDAYLAQIESLIELATDTRWWFAAGGEPGAVAVCALAITGHWNQGGGSAEISLATVCSHRDGRFDRFEFYPSEALADQRARVTELTTRRARQS